jgi:uncharacterized protein YoxC
MGKQALEEIQDGSLDTALDSGEFETSAEEEPVIPGSEDDEATEELGEELDPDLEDGGEEEEEAKDGSGGESGGELTSTEKVYLNMVENLGEEAADAWLEAQTKEDEPEVEPEVVDDSDPDMAVDQEGQFNLIAARLNSTIDNVNSQYDSLRTQYNGLAHERDQIVRGVNEGEVEFADIQGRYQEITNSLAQIQSKADGLKANYAKLNEDRGLVQQVEQVAGVNKFIKRNLFTYMDMVVNGRMPINDPIPNQVVKLKAFLGQGSNGTTKLTKEKQEKLRQLGLKISSKSGGVGSREKPAVRGKQDDKQRALHPDAIVNLQMQEVYKRIAGGI